MSSIINPSDSVLSFRDIPPHRSHARIPVEEPPTRLLYKPNHDLQFDLEMAQRRGDKESKPQSAQDPLPYGDEGSETKADDQETIPTGLEFGSKLESEHPFDEETLNSLLLPPSPEYYPGFERELRPNAIYLYNRSVGLLKTEQIISHVLQTVSVRDLEFEHLEWIDDFSCVLAFASKSAAIDAFSALLLKPDEVEGENGLSEAIDFLSLSTPTPPSQDVLVAAADFIFTLRPSKPLASNLFATSQPNAILHPDRPEKLVPFIRFATAFDIKRRNAKDHSLFYVLHGARAGRDGVHADRAKPPPQPAKRRRVSNNSSGLADLPGRWSHADPSDIPASHSRQISRLPSGRGSGGNHRRSGMLPTSADLDDELDRFMARGATSANPDETAAEDGEEQRLADNRPSKRHERARDLDSEPERFNEEDLFPRSRLGGGNLDDRIELFAAPDSQRQYRPRSPSEDGLRTWIVQSDQQANEEELGEDEELVDEYVEMIDEETGQKIKRLIQSRRRKSRLPALKSGWGSSHGRLI
ncbi:hypothetical protein CROQUDRAFT_659480 [Cronartium quercuum f. sp. fusiforme G11]|uniref:Uncharacterized protein n=1 Tax=Cronartium quercuum f. sp. fusiforme G11 TaxID=708437 RepID=A0A9P6TAN9_9BASI|nr:hypothetical protein CROQUDRAFT_659480 [Cronartium quercuum f. sp. fusiforme G11]